MTKRQAENYSRLTDTLARLGFDYAEREALIRIERTLARWGELECGTDAGHIERDETTGKPRLFNAQARYVDPHDPRAWRAIPDREAGALKRLAKLMASRPHLLAYHQGDPRGCALYVVPANAVGPGESLDAVYTRGVAICY